MIAGATTRPQMLLARFSGYIPEGGRLRNRSRKRACLRTLALIQL
jgi:hypothetical protein